MIIAYRLSRSAWPNNLLLSMALLNYVLVSLVLLSASIETASCSIYFIMSTEVTGEPACLMKSCLTLSQFVENIDAYTDPNMTLIIMRGNHDLNEGLYLSNFEEISMFAANDFLSSSVTCTKHTAHFSLISIRRVYIRGIKFIGCNGNTIRLVDQVTISTSTFVKSSTETPLTIIESQVNLEQCTFAGNSNGKHLKCLRVALKTFSGTETAGGALIVQNSTITIDTCLFMNNTANIGGAIFSDSESKLTIINSLFTHNRAISCDKRLCIGGVLFVTGTLSSTLILNCTFRNNTSGQYGAVVAAFRTNPVTSTFKNNDSSGDGEPDLGIAVDIKLCTFGNNYAKLGGVVYLYESNIFISDSNFQSNIAQRVGGVISADASSIVAISGSQFLFNKAEIEDGVINIKNKSSLQINYSIIENNTANGKGGAIFVNYNCSLVIETCTLTNNSSVDDAGVAFIGNYSTANIRATNFSGNSAQDNAAVLFVQMHSAATVESSYFLQNKAKNDEGVARIREWSTIRINSCIFSENMAGSKTGVITALQQSLAIVEDSSFINNTASELGGTVQIQYQSAAVIHKSIFINSHADDGAVLYIAKNSSANISHSWFINNFARIYGGVISSKQNCLITVIESDFTNNTALDTGSVFYLEDKTNMSVQNCFFTSNSGGFGGVLAAKRNCSILIRYSIFDDNIAHVDGGCIYARAMCTLTIESSLITENNAKNNGIFLLNDHGNILIENDTFAGNNAGHDGAAIYALDRSTVHINHSGFTGNKANNSGGIVFVRRYSNITIINSTMYNNTAENSGGAVFGQDNSHISIQKTNITNSRADYGGGLLIQTHSTVFISSCNFTQNTATLSGGVIGVYKNKNVTVKGCFFTANRAKHGGVLHTFSNAYITFMNNHCSQNRAIFGGAIRVIEESRVNIIENIFSNNTAEFGGAVCIQQSNINLEGGCLEHNRATIAGGVMYAEHNSTINTARSVFFNNTAVNGGAISLLDSNVTAIAVCNFTSNTATVSGGTIDEQNSSVRIYNSTFVSSKAGMNGGIVQATNSKVNIQDSILNGSNALVNGGAIYAHFSSSVSLSNVIFSKNSANDFGGVLSLNKDSKCTIIDSVFQGNKAEIQGGAIAVWGCSSLNISESIITNNEANMGGGLVCSESSTLSFQSESNSKGRENTLTNNTAKDGNGGGICILDSMVSFKHSITIGFNQANGEGGGIYAYYSTIFVGSPVNISSNEALRGGGVSLANSKIFNKPSEDTDIYFTFDNNYAQSGRGQALFVDDDVNNNTVCFSDPFSTHNPKASGCFFEHVTNTLIMSFISNFPKPKGSTIFGGLMDRCAVASFVNDSTLEQSAINRFKEITNINNFDIETISSKPVRVCPCNDGILKCNQHIYGHVPVKSGDKFTVELSAVDQVNHSVPATICSRIDGASLNENETVRRLDSNCSILDYSVIFPIVPQTYDLMVYAEGPCKNKSISTLTVKIDAMPCSCKAGFMQEHISTKCSCICDKSDETFSKYIKECDSTLESVKREGEFWITYLHDSDNNSSPYFIYPYCPLEYCQPPTEEVFINLSQPDGSDAQCVNNRHGILCGSCKPRHSLSLGDSKCIKCPQNWHKLLVGINVIALVAGVLLVFLLLFLNLTVAIGTINSIIFYANIIFANRSIFFIVWQLKFTFVPVFVSWLNMDIGLDVCFYEGMDTYVKTWLQLAFPLYIFALVFALIWFTSFSSKFSNLIGRRNPVATLATLILLSYTKLLESIIKSFSFVKLRYPNGTYTINWLPDARYEYKDWKIILLTCAAIVILIFGLLYTVLIFSWQWLVCYSRSRCFRWTTNQKLHTFIVTYHTPYTAKHRYWTGLLLLVRVIVYLTSAFSLPIDPRITLLTTAIIMCSLLLYKSVLKVRIYKNKILNAMESFALFNIAIFVLFTWYNFENPNKTSRELFQMIAAYVSVGTMLLLSVFVLMYHLYRFGNSKVYSLCQNTKIGSKLNDQFTYVQEQERLTQFDGNSYRLFDTIDTPRDLYMDGENNLSKLKIPLRGGPTRSSVSLKNCSESSLGMSETQQSEEILDL